MRIAIALAVVMLSSCGGDDDVSRLVGAQCTNNDECDDRCLGPNDHYPDGFCSIDCESSDDCPVDARCADRDGGVCLFGCSSNAQCAFLGPAWNCREIEVRDNPNTKVNVCVGD